MGVRSRSGIARIVGDLETQGLLTRRRESGHFYLDVGRSQVDGHRTATTAIEWLDVPERAGFLEPWQVEPLAIPGFMLGIHQHEKVRAFCVTDDEMVGVNICERDIGLVELRQFARDGECIVAVLEDTWSVLRKYYRMGSEIELRASDNSPTPSVIRMPADHVEIKGVFRGLLRTMA